MTSRDWPRALASSLGIVVAPGCAAARSQDVVTIDVASPRTGAQAGYGRNNQNGAQTAIDDPARLCSPSFA